MVGPAAAAPASSRSAPWRDPRIIGAAAALVIVLGVAVVGTLALLGGGDDDGDVSSALDFAGPLELTDTERSNYLAAADALPNPAPGQSETEYLHGLLGRPDAFEIAFTQESEAGQVTRAETWYYYDYDSSFVFLDGTFLYSVAIEEPGSLALIAPYDPLAITESTTLEDLRAMVSDPANLVQEEPPAVYELSHTFWAGEQLQAVFDSSGALVAVDAVIAGLVP